MVTYVCPKCGFRLIIGLEISRGQPKHKCPKCGTEMKKDYSKNWEGSLKYESARAHFKSAIQLPIYVLGVDF